MVVPARAMNFRCGLFFRQISVVLNLCCKFCQSCSICSAMSMKAVDVAVGGENLENWQDLKHVYDDSPPRIRCVTKNDNSTQILSV